MTVTAKQDDDAKDESTNVSLAASGGDYGAESATVAVKVKDDDTSGLVVAPSRLDLVEGAAGKTFAVKLATEPTATVTVSLTSEDPGAATVSPASLTFSTTNHGTVQTVTVTGKQDDDGKDETTNVSLAASGGDYGDESATVAVKVTDDDTTGLVVAPSRLDLVEGAAGKTFEVKLATEPTASVTVSLTREDPGAASVSPASLTFTTSNYGATQTVTVTAKEDEDAKDESTNVNLAASGGDYGDESATVAVEVTDDDTSGLVVAPSSLDLIEGAAGKTFEVKLATEPTATVTVSVTSEDPGAATVSPASLTFTTSNYGATQTVTVTAKQDDDAKDESTKINLAASGGDYGDESATVAVKVTDDDTSALVVAPSSLELVEGAAGKTFTVKLTAEPSATVTVGVESRGADTASVSPASLTFAAGNYGVTQTVTVTGEKAGATTVDLSASGGGYGAVSAEVAVTVAAPDTSPAFGKAGNETFVKGEPVAVDLQVTGGNAPVECSVSPALPVGVKLDAAACVLSGTPTETQAALEYTFTATDADDDGTTLSFTIAVTAPTSDDASFVRFLGVPATMTAGSSATVTVRMRNTGTTTWSASGGYQLGSQRPDDNETWGLSRVALSSDVAPGGTVDFVFAVTAPETAGRYSFRWKMIRGATEWFGRKTELKQVEVSGEAVDDASFVEYGSVPSRMAAGSSATVTVRMRNTGTTTWTSSAGYQLGSQRPDDNARWGLSRVAPPSDVAPNGEVDFTFDVTAPEKVKGHKFRWRMVRGADGWFGDRTELHEITVEDPSFGDAAVSDQTWAKNVPIESLSLPEAGGGDGALTYALTPSLPEGVTFTAATRSLSGTPTVLQEATEYTWTATDTDGDAAVLVFSIRVEEASLDDASFVSVSGVPSKIAAGHAATVTVTMENTGTTMWTSFGGYGLAFRSPRSKDTWGLRRAPLPGSVAPGETVEFEFPITAPETTGSYTFAWQMVRDPGMRFGSDTGLLTIKVEDPSFGDQTVADRTWLEDEPLAAVVLPAASGGEGTLSYGLAPELPAGVSFDPETRVLSGTPTTPQAAVEYTYTARDEEGSAAELVFFITVEQVLRDDASFVSISGVPSKIAAGHAATVTVTMKNTGTTTWTPFGGYGLGAWGSPSKDTWGVRRAPLSGSVAPNETVEFTFKATAPETTGSYKFVWRMVRDPGMWFGPDTGDVRITVEDPSFGDGKAPDQTWVQGEKAAFTLPAASGGDGPLTYALTPAPPDGVAFDPSTRVLSGTPTALQPAKAYIYTATDKEGSAATLAFTITVSQPLNVAQESMAPAPGGGGEDRGSSPPSGVFDMFEYWLLPHGRGLTVEAGGRQAVRSFWRGELWGRTVALPGDPEGRRYDIFEEVGDGLDYWGTFEGASAVGEDRLSASLDRPFRWMNRFMAVGDVLEAPVTGRLLSERRRNQASVVKTTMRLEILAHRASFDVPAAPGLTFEDVLVARFWPDAARPEAHDTFVLARGLGAVHWRRSGVAAPGEVALWWAVGKELTPVALSAPSVPWFDPFSPGWPKTAVVNGNLEDAASGAPGGADAGQRTRAPGEDLAPSVAAPGWRAGSGHAIVGPTPPGLAGGDWSLLLPGGADGADMAITEDWIPVAGGTYELSACMLRENAADNVFVDLADGKGRDADFVDAHLVAGSTGVWECRAVAKCIPASVGAVRVRAVRGGAAPGDAWFDRIELKRIAACEERPGNPEP